MSLDFNDVTLKVSNHGSFTAQKNSPRNEAIQFTLSKIEQCLEDDSFKLLLPNYTIFSGKKLFVLVFSTYNLHNATQWHPRRYRFSPVPEAWAVGCILFEM